jgi:hypothetical protein
MNKILKIARYTDDRTTLAGAFIALSTSRYIVSAGTDLILKLLRAAIGKEEFVSSLFGRYSRSSDDLRESAIIADVAESVLQAPEDYAFRTVCSAASFLADYYPVNTAPLLAEEETLGLQVKRPE